MASRSQSGAKKGRFFRKLRKVTANRGQPIFDMFPETRLDSSIPLGFTPRAKRFGVGPAMSAFRKPTARHGAEGLRTALGRADAESGPGRVLRPTSARRRFTTGAVALGFVIPCCNGSLYKP